MQPLAISHFSIVNGLGAGSTAVAGALRARQSGLRACDFETVTLDTWIGRVAGLDEFRVRADLAAYDCRNNRLAQLGLESDGYAAAVNAAREKYGAARIGVFLGTSTSGILQTELAYRRRDPQTGALPADFRYAETQNTFSLADFVQFYFGLSGPAFVVSSACSSSAKVFGHAARMMAAGVCDAAVVGGVDSLCLPLRHGPRRHLHRRRRGLCAAGKNAGSWRCDVVARRRRELRCLSHVHPAPGRSGGETRHAACAGCRGSHTR
jgi:3-oxoacyl-[acyl-carrier-protein] synthase-1